MKKLGEVLGYESKTHNCEAHGEYLSHSFIPGRWSVCPKCMDDRQARDEEARIAALRQNAIETWVARVEGAGIPMRFQNRTFATYRATTEDQRTALQFAQWYANTFEEARKTGRSALFSGNPGTGKTHLASAIGMEVLSMGKSVMFTTVLRAVRRIKDTWARNGGEAESTAIQAFVYPDLLILDEVGIQYGSHAEKVILFDLLNERYERCKPTILLTNLPIAEAKEYLGERVFDRLREGGGEYIGFHWESHRGNV
jgi:DNA replication protein DnaC